MNLGGVNGDLRNYALNNPWLRKTEGTKDNGKVIIYDPYTDGDSEKNKKLINYMPQDTVRLSDGER